VPSRNVIPFANLPSQILPIINSSATHVGAVEREYQMSDYQDPFEEVLLHEKHEALIAKGWRVLTKFEGVLTKYLPPGAETGAMLITAAYALIVGDSLN
jgi:hypothetical protein